MKRLALCFAVLAALVGSPTASQAWDSGPTSTHAKFTEWAIDQLASRYPVLAQYREIIVDGADTELHELPVSGSRYGVDFASVQNRGTNEGTNDIQAWWRDASAAYGQGDFDQAFFILGIVLHYMEDMGVPAHAHHLIHQGPPNDINFDNFEFMAFTNWNPSFADINRADPGYREPWRYYAFQEAWTFADSPNYLSIDQFSLTWTFASDEERALLRNRQGRTATLTQWVLASAMAAFGY